MSQEIPSFNGAGDLIITWDFVASFAVSLAATSFTSQS